MRALVILLTLSATAGSACYQLKPVDLGDLGEQRTARIWVTTPDHSTVLVHDAQVFRGNLVGFVDGKYRVLPPADLFQIRVRRLATGRTVALLATSAVALSVAVVLLSGGEDVYDPCVGGPVDCHELARIGWTYH
jgi:hypothetical protein